MDTTTETDLEMKLVLEETERDKVFVDIIVLLTVLRPEPSFHILDLQLRERVNFLVI